MNRLLALLVTLISSVLAQHAESADCSQVLKTFQQLTQSAPGKVLISSVENVVGTRLMQLDDYGTIRFFEAACLPSGGASICESTAVSSQAQAVDGQNFDKLQKQNMAWKIDAQDRLLLRPIGSSFFYPVTVLQCDTLAFGSFIRAQNATAREANLYHIILRNNP